MTSFDPQTKLPIVELEDELPRDILSVGSLLIPVFAG